MGNLVFRENYLSLMTKSFLKRKWFTHISCGYIRSLYKKDDKYFVDLAYSYHNGNDHIFDPHDSFTYILPLQEFLENISSKLYRWEN